MKKSRVQPRPIDHLFAYGLDAAIIDALKARGVTTIDDLDRLGMDNWPGVVALEVRAIAVARQRLKEAQDEAERPVGVRAVAVEAAELIRPRGTLRPRAMNRTERDYAGILNARRCAREIAWFAYEAVKLRLADDTYYTPDFLVMLTSGEFQCHEVKGFMRDDAWVKLKVAAEQLPIPFFLAKRKGKGWSVEAV